MLVTSPVRKAKPEDRAAVLEICEQDWRENAQFSFSASKVEKKISDILDGHGGVIGVIQRTAEIEAIIITQLGQFWYTEEWCLEEMANYVRPEYRRSTNAKDMILFGKRCSDDLGIPLVIGVVSNERTKAKMELYRRQLGEPVGGYFYYKRRPLVATAAVG